MNYRIILTSIVSVLLMTFCVEAQAVKCTGCVAKTAPPSSTQCYIFQFRTAFNNRTTKTFTLIHTNYSNIKALNKAFPAQIKPTSEVRSKSTGNVKNKNGFVYCQDMPTVNGKPTITATYEADDGSTFDIIAPASNEDPTVTGPNSKTYKITTKVSTPYRHGNQYGASLNFKMNPTKHAPCRLRPSCRVAVAH